MRKIIFLIFLFTLISLNAHSDPVVMNSYMQRFIRADLLGKIDILNEASSDTRLGESKNQLYEYALQFVLDNYAQIDDLRDMNSVAGISINGLLECRRIDNIDLLWNLFSVYPDSETRADIIVALSVLSGRDSGIIDRINNYLMRMNNSFRDGEAVDYTVVSACITALMGLGGSSSYPVLFAIICSDFPEVINNEAFGALEVIPGNLHQFLLGVIENSPPLEKFAAFRVVTGNDRLSVWERGQLAELALEKGLTSGEDIDLSAMRYAAVSILTNLRWKRANTLAIRHYYRVQADFQHGAVPKERLVEAIACLGAVGNSDAALVLCLQLGLINARANSTGAYDADITLAIVRALGLIGDDAAFDHLLFASNLPYDENITTAAMEAIDLLRW